MMRLAILHRSRPFVALVVCAMAIGCGTGGNPFKSVPVSGKVTYEDGSAVPVSGMKVYFHSLLPPKDGLHPRPATADVGPDGTFKDVTTYKYADGLVLGEHKVSLVCKEGAELTKKIPREYALPAETPLRVEVTKSGQFLEIKVPKPPT